MAYTTSISLLERLKQPGGEAWTRFVHLYGPLLFKWAKGLGLREHDAADLVQDVLTVLVRRLPTFEYRYGGSFRAWLKTVALHCWRDRRPRTPLAEPAQAEAVADARNGADPAEFVADEEYRHYVVGRALKLLQSDFQPATWRAFWEHAVVGRPAADVARELDMSVDAIYAARSRVMRRLRQELAGLAE